MKKYRIRKGSVLDRLLVLRHYHIREGSVLEAFCFFWCLLAATFMFFYLFY